MSSDAIIEGGSPCCYRCKRPGILVVQYVLPNKWVEAEKRYVCAPTVWRHYLCRWHLGAENNPNCWRRKGLGGGRRKKVDFIADEILIQHWQDNEFKRGSLTEKLGWQMEVAASQNP